MRNRTRTALFAALTLAVAAGTLLSSHAPAGPADMLALLIRAQGVSGDEAGVRDIVSALLPAWAHPRTDEIGNLLVTAGQGRPRVLIAAAIDEDGYIVSRITDEGYLRVRSSHTGRCAARIPATHAAGRRPRRLQVPAPAHRGARRCQG